MPTDPNTNPGAAVSISNTPQAKNDVASGAENGVFVIDVMANDLGGSAKSLYSVDQSNPLTVATTATTALGATVTMVDGKVRYVANGSQIDKLAAGQTATDTFTYVIRLANGALSTATVTVTVTGTNDGPVLAADTTAVHALSEIAGATDGAGVIASSATLGFTDLDLNDTHTVSLGAPAATWSGGAVIPAATLAALAAAASATVTDSTGSGVGSVGVNFSLADNLTDFLAAGETLMVTYNVTIKDNNNAASTQPVTFKITGTNDRPVANADSGAGAENQTLTLDVLANDTDVDNGATKTLVSATAPSGKGSASVVANQLVFNPGAAFDHLAQGATETVTLSYTMQDDQGAQATSTVTVTVTGTNDGPVAVADAASTTENQAITVDVLANDTDVDDGHVFTLVAVGAPAGKGSVAIVDNKLAFNPGADFDHLALGASETVTLTYTMQDEHGAQSSSTVTLTVTGTNDGPVAVADAASTTENQAITVDVLANDTDVDDGHVFTVVAVGAPAGKGSVAIVDNKLAFNPGADFDHLALGVSETVTLTYTMQDEHGAQSSSTVTLTVTGQNDGPVAVADAASTTENQAITVDVLANDTDVDDGHVFTVVAAGAPAGKGSVAIVDNKLAFNPGADFDHLALGVSETVTLTYTMQDEHGAQSSSTVTLTVTGTNDGPVAVADSASTTENQAITVDVLANDTDVDDGHVFTVVAVGAPAGKGSVAIVDNKLAFNPGADFDHLALGVSETVTLTYTMQDEHGAQSSSTVTLTVTGANDGPVAVADASAAVEDGSAVTINVLANDTDADAGDSKTLVSVDTTGAVGSVTANPDGTVSYNPGGAFQNLAQGQTTTDTFTYTMRDAAGAVSTATVTVTIMGTNDAPKVTGAVTGAALEGGASVTLNAIANASDVDTGAVLGVVNVPAALPAGVTYDGATKSFTLNPANSAYDSLAVGETRTVTVSYGVTDGIATTPASVSWTVTGANDAPVVQPAQSANLLTNGDFSAGATGWSNAGSGGAIEVLSAGTYGVTGMSGNVLELDANTGGGADDVSQTVATQPGTAYLLSFDTAARSGVPASSNSFQVLFNGQVIATLSPSSTAAQHYSFEVVSSGSTGKVEFREVGTNDSLGGIIDNVSLQATGFSEASGQTGSSAVDSFAQTLAFTDVDLSDTHTVTVGAPSVTYSAGAAPAGLAAALATAMAVSLTESAGAGRVSATFAATDSTFDFLAAGEKLTVTYNVTVIDNHGGSSTQPVTVVVTGTNDKPIVSGPVSGSAAEGGAAVTLNALANASDVDHAAVLSVVNVPATLPAGVTYDATTKSFTLNPTDPAYNQLAAGVSQTVSVTYGVSDGTATTPATATWTITGTNDAPVITGRLIGDTVEGGPSLAFNALSNASDPDGDPLSVVVFSSPLPAGVSYNPATNTFSFDPTHIAYNSLSQSEATTVSVQYGVSDGAAVTGGAVTWTLRGTNDNPIAQADSRSTSEDASITINVLANDSDPDNLDTVTLSSVQSTSARGAAVTIVNGQVVYNPTGSAQLQALNNGQSVVDTFTYTVTDSYGGTATQTVNVTVNGVTDFGAANDTAATGEDNRIYIDVLGNDTGAGLTVIGLNGGGTTGTSAQGAVIQVANNQVFYNPQNAAALQALNDGQSLTDTFTYTVRDSSGNTSTATVTVTVAGNSGGIVNSGITATMGFNSAANGSAPLSHTEGGMTVQSFYDPSAGPHVHFGNYGGDATMDLMNHNGCCSTPYEFRYFNPDNADTTFSVNGFQNIVGTGTWITSKGSLVISQIGYVDLSNNPIFQDIEWLRWDTSSSQNAIDNFSFDA